MTRRPVVLAFVAVLIGTGTYNFATMSRREDPELTIREALIITAWPGAPATRVEELITDPIEDVIVEIAEVDTIESKSMVGLSIIEVTAGDDITDVDQVWDDVRAKVDPVRGQMPQGSVAPFVNSDFGDVYEIVFALHRTPFDESLAPANYSPRELEVFAERIEEEIELVDSVRRVEFWGVQPERIYVEIDSADWAQLDLTLDRLRALFEARNIVLPGGELDTEQSRYAVNPTGEFTSVRQMLDLIVDRAGGTLPVRLGDLPVRIERRYDEPFRSKTRLTTPEATHQESLVIGISMKSGRNIAALNTDVEAALSRLRSTVLPPDLALTRVNDLPRQVTTRIDDFQSNLIQGVAIVFGVALLFMGWRPALIMASAVPLSMIAAFAFVPYLGVELEQFAIASLVIVLGMVVDNAIVVSDNADQLMKDGIPRFEAAVRGAQDLSIPILTSTLTTIAAFLPMLTMTGSVGEYISSLPIVVAATLTTSYFVAMVVTPIMCGLLLKPASGLGRGSAQASRLLRPYDGLVRWCLDHPFPVLLLTGLLLLGSLSILPIIGTQFFPSGSRDQFFVKVWLPEGSAIAQTSKVALQVEEALTDTSPIPSDDGPVERLANVVTFIGTGGPRLMATQEPEYDYPYFALLLVNTTDATYTNQYAQDIRERVRNIVDARITVDLFMLGPPIKDAVAFRLSGPDREVIANQAGEMVRRFKQVPGTLDPYSNWGSPSYQAEIEVDVDAVNLAGVTNADVALTTSAVLSGAPLTSYREGDHTVPVVLRTIREKREDLSDFSDIYVGGRFGKVPLDSIADVSQSWQPAVIARRGGLPTVTIGTRVDPGQLANTVANQVEAGLNEMLAALPPGYFVEAGGELEETAAAQGQMVLAVGISIVLMILVLITQYNSLVKPAVILLTVPMAMIGVLVGLLVTGWAMGFMAMLGILALGGIVINNAIVLIDFIESRVTGGSTLRDAVGSAGRARMRPIILTTLTTIGGLLPLSLFGGALWAPMTNGMIFGLIFSTALTLIVVPTIYVLFAERLGMAVVATEASSN